MHDRGKIITGIAIFLVLILFPIWFTLASGDFTPPDLGDVKKITGKDDCVRDVEFMRSNHMDLLDQWRDTVVREGVRTYTSEMSGKTFNMSLSDTCLDCHSDKKQFCDACHTYSAVDPYCWDCHVIPEEAP